MAGIRARCDPWGLPLLGGGWTPPSTVLGACLGLGVGETGKDPARVCVLVCSFVRVCVKESLPPTLPNQAVGVGWGARGRVLSVLALKLRKKCHLKS